MTAAGEPFTVTHQGAVAALEVMRHQHRLFLPVWNTLTPDDRLALALVHAEYDDFLQAMLRMLAHYIRLTDETVVDELTAEGLLGEHCTPAELRAYLERPYDSEEGHEGMRVRDEAGRVHVTSDMVVSAMEEQRATVEAGDVLSPDVLDAPVEQRWEFHAN